MAEFCLDCWNRINDTKDSPRKYIFCKELALCEGCGKEKPIILIERKAYYLHKFRYILFPFRVLYILVYALCRLFVFPFFLYRLLKEKRDR